MNICWLFQKPGSFYFINIDVHETIIKDLSWKCCLIVSVPIWLTDARNVARSKSILASVKPTGEQVIAEVNLHLKVMCSSHVTSLPLQVFIQQESHPYHYCIHTTDQTPCQCLFLSFMFKPAVLLTDIKTILYPWLQHHKT